MTGVSWWVRKARELNERAEEIERRLAEGGLDADDEIRALKDIAELRKQAHEEEKGARLVTTYRLSKFGPKPGSKDSTLQRITYIRHVASEIGDCKRQILALTIWKSARGQELFESYNSLYNFLGRADIFDGAGNGQT